MLEPTSLELDNQSAIKLAWNSIFPDKTKYFEVDWHVTQQKIESGEVTIEYVPINEQPVNILTKALGRTKFEIGRDQLHLKFFDEILHP